jgi:hypothetical protein
VGCDAVRWQGETTLRARARKEEQRGQRAAAWRNRVRSARYKLDLALEANKVSIHAALRGIEERPGEICGLMNRASPGVVNRLLFGMVCQPVRIALAGVAHLHCGLACHDGKSRYLAVDITVSA